MPGNTSKIKAFLILKGYWSVVQKGSILRASRGRLSPLGSIFLHASFLFIPLGLLLSSYYSFQGYAVVTEGQSFEAGKVSSYISITPEKVRKSPKSLPLVSFRLDTIRPVFWEDKLLFTDLSAGLTYSEDDISRYRTLRLNSPWFYKGNFIAIRGFGYSPYYRITDSKGNVVDESFVNLKVFPSGMEDSFAVKAFPYKVKVTVYSDYIIKNGKFETKSHNLTNPLFQIKLADKNDKPVCERFLMPGDILKYGGYSIIFPEIRYYGEFSVFRDQGIWVIFAGLLTACVG
ncbi:MAG: cytochrome c biogenesis protein ResB, partial [Eubacteriales bacterium]